MKRVLMTFAVASILALVSSHAQKKDVQPKFDVNTDINLFLYTRNNPTESQQLLLGNVSVLQASNYDPNKPVKFLVHGWNAPPESTDFRDAFLAVADVNVILVDWTKGSTGEEPPVLANAPLVGVWLASFIDWLSDFGDVFNAIHIVAISIGSHVSGFAGRNCKKGTVEYITACDPSKTSWVDNDERINPGDARYVEIIHSNSESAGLVDPTGHVDFYPNGGAFMPGCTDIVCSHMRAYQYFLDSLDNEYFVAKECTNYAELASGSCANLTSLYMGGTKPKYNRTGVFYLETNEEKPYYKF